MSVPWNLVVDGDTLRFQGPLTRDSVPVHWGRLPADHRGVKRFDLRAVAYIDSAGLALLSLLATRCGGVEVEGDPEGLADLRGAYRLGHDLTFARD